MDWGIVVSVLVAMALFLAAVAILVLTMIGLFVWRIKKQTRTQGKATFKFPDCCEMIKSARNAQ